MGAKEADIWPAVTVPCLMARRPGIWLEFRAASETCCRTRAAAAFPNQQNKIPGWQRGGGLCCFFFLHSPAACRRTQRQIQSWHRMKLCLACGAVERCLLDCVWHLIQDSGQAFWNCGWIFHGLMDWDPAWNDVGAAAAPSLNVNAERSEILSMFPEKERQDVYKELRGGLIVLHISADAIHLYFILFFFWCITFFFSDVKGRGSMGFSPGWKAVNVQSIKLTASMATSVWGHLIFGLSPELHPLIISLLFSNSSTGFLSNFTWTLKSCLPTFKAIHNIDLCMCIVWRNQDGTQESYL